MRLGVGETGLGMGFWEKMCRKAVNPINPHLDDLPASLKSLGLGLN